MPGKRTPNYEVPESARKKAARVTGKISAARSNCRLLRISGEVVTVSEAERHTGLERQRLLNKVRAARAKHGTVEWSHLEERA